MELFKEYPDIVSVEQVSEMLRIGQVLAYRLVRSGEIKSRKTNAGFNDSIAATQDDLQLLVIYNDAENKIKEENVNALALYIVFT